MFHLSCNFSNCCKDTSTKSELESKLDIFQNVIRHLIFAIGVKLAESIQHKAKDQEAHEHTKGYSSKACSRHYAISKRERTDFLEQAQKRQYQPAPRAPRQPEPEK